MTTDTNAITRATHADVDRLGDVLTRAFFRTPDVVWLMPDEGERAAVLGRFARALLHHCADVGIVDTTTDRDAAAIWWAHDAIDALTYQKLVEDNCGPYAGPVLELGGFLAEWAPAQPHQYLAYLGVHPSRQRTGRGSALLRHRHTILDRNRQPAYLVATTPESRDLYLRHGYTLRGQEPLRPKEGPPLWPMWREAKS